MSPIAIDVQHLSKRYRIGQREPYRAFRDVLSRALTAPFAGWKRLTQTNGSGGFGSHLRSPSPGPLSHFWALKDVSFSVAQGEVVGIIGRNGAGKSTLLKILSRITKPTSGQATLHGRIGSLLEVGTGFHPELTGRENIFLNGAILGMRHVEIQRKFDEIVAFAEVEKFLDTPVKHYSSGMYVRLAFAVAAHLDPEILFVDEVLAVGDAAFQKKCLGKMGEVAKGGRTVIFVSHQMSHVRRLCERAIWLEGGQVRVYDTVGSVVNLYEAASLRPQANSPAAVDGFLQWEVVDHGHVIRTSMSPLSFRLMVHLQQPITNGHFGLALINDANCVVAGWAFENLALEAGAQELWVEVQALPLRPGVYSLLCSLFHQGNNLTGGDLVASWNAVPELRIETPPVAHPQDAWAGVLNLPANLRVRQVNDAAA